jgi:hypothetical protein
MYTDYQIEAYLLPDPHHHGAPSESGSAGQTPAMKEPSPFDQMSGRMENQDMLRWSRAT